MRRLDCGDLRMDGIYPWQGPQWAQCRRRIQAGTLPHALLLNGRPGLGKLDFAHRLAQSLLCDRPGEEPCGSCKGCRLFMARNHPDYLEKAIEGDSRQIKIDQIRALNYFMSLSRKSGHHKIALIAGADTMNRNAANGLLKTLEEPPSFSLILLVTARPSLLPPTIISRCQQIRFTLPPRAVAAAWLERLAPDADADTLLAAAQGEPLKALELSRGGLLETRAALLDDLARLASAHASPVAVAERWQQHTPDLLLSWLLSWLTDIARLLSTKTFSRLSNPDVEQHLRALAKRVDFKALFSLYDTLLQHRNLQHASLNRQLMLEDVLLAWASAFNPDEAIKKWRMALQV